MSRCFPYPPPTYGRAAEIEITKLQKERENKEKKGRKKERKMEKKAAQQGEKLEISKHSKHSHKKRKHEDIGLVGQKEMKKASDDLVEQFEKSGLSEEHELPCFIQTMRGSPESSQDSNKRRKVIVSASPSQTNNGNILRIKLPIVKQRDPVPPPAMLVKPRVPEQPPVKQMGPDPSVAKRRSDVQPRITTMPMVKSTVSQQQNIMTQRKGDLPGVPKRVHTQPPAKVMLRVDSQPSANVMQRFGPQPTAKVIQRVDPQSSAKVMTQRVDPLLPSKVAERVDPPLLSKVTRRVDTQPPAKVMQKERSAVPLVRRGVEQPAVVQKAALDPLVAEQREMDATPPKEEPSFSGRNTEAASSQEVRHSSSDRKSRKAEKKEGKFSDLFVTWNPPSIQMEDMDLGDQDWLFDSTRRSDANPSNCKANEGALLYQSTDQLFSLQPRAIHLPDLHMYQLPYVVPF